MGHPSPAPRLVVGRSSTPGTFPPPPRWRPGVAAHRARTSAWPSSWTPPQPHSLIGAWFRHPPSVCLDELLVPGQELVLPLAQLPPQALGLGRVHGPEGVAQLVHFPERRAPDLVERLAVE